MAWRGHSIFPHDFLGTIRGFSTLVMWLSPAGTTIQHCHLLTVLFHYSTDKAHSPPPDHKKKNQTQLSRKRQFIFKDLLNIHIWFKKAKMEILRVAIFLEDQISYTHLL